MRYFWIQNLRIYAFLIFKQGGQEELKRHLLQLGRDIMWLKMATMATMFAKDKLMKQLPLNVV